MRDDEPRTWQQRIDHLRRDPERPHVIVEERPLRIRQPEGKDGIDVVVVDVRAPEQDPVVGEEVEKVEQRKPLALREILVDDPGDLVVVRVEQDVLDLEVALSHFQIDDQPLVRVAALSTGTLAMASNGSTPGGDKTSTSWPIARSAVTMLTIWLPSAPLPCVRWW
jgi:hypothetical protein